MRKAFLVLIIMLICSICISCSSSTHETDETIAIIEDVEQFSGISTKELKSIMGEPDSEESWVNKTSKGDFDVITISYEKNSNHYEFIAADDTIIRLTIYSNDYWNNSGDRFPIIGDKEDICKSFNITLGDDVKKVTDNNFTYTLSPVNDKVAMFDVQDIDADTYGFVKITYNLNYFD